MKKLKLILVLSLICISFVIAQDYQTVLSNRINYFENISGNIECIRIDSVSSQNDSVFYFMSNIQEKDNYECFTPYGASWLGDKVIIQKNGTNLFFNKNQDTIKIKIDATLGESWVAFELADSIKIYAEIIKHDTLNFLGQHDSVKTVSFEVYDRNMDLLEYPLNAMEIKISRLYGLIKTFNFYLFPNLYTNYANQQFEEYNLIGLSNPKVGISNLKWFEVYNFQLNDELHVLEEVSNWLDDDGYSTSTKNIYKYLERFDYPDSIVYSYTLKQSIQTTWSDSSSLIFTYDTIRSIIKPNSLFDKLPGEPIINGGETYSYDMTNGDEVSKTNPREYESFSNSGDDCWYPIVADGCLRANRFIKGLGGPYYKCVNAFSLGGAERKLVFYKKGESTWGSPFNITSLKANFVEDNIIVFPIPAKNILNIRSQEASPQLVFEIFNSVGDLLLIRTLNTKESKLNIESLISGIYFYRLRDGNDILKTDKLIIK